jgi:threonine dehydrogenase-like Zn-dependent dehydrogenase
METALNALWDSGAGPSDRIVVVGAGVVGLLVASLAARLPGAEATVVDVEEARRPLAEALGAAFALPAAAPGEADIVFHASASAAGLDTAIGCAGLEGAIVEMSWYGDRPVEVGLGGAFHSRRLRLVSSQVGLVSPSRRPRWDYRRRMQAALGLLEQPALDLLVAEEIAFEEAPRQLPRILSLGAHGLAPVIRYPSSDSG